MKRVLTFLLIVVAVLFVACMKTEPTDEPTAATTEATTEAPTAPQEFISVEGDKAPSEPLSDALLYELEEYYNANPGFGTIYVYDKAFGSVHPYYGIYDGYIVFATIGNLYTVTNISIADETFYYHQAITFFAYKNGEFTLLENLYAEGKISDKAIKEIAAYHREYYDIENYIMHDLCTSIPDDLEIPVFDDETMGKIKAAWSDKERAAEHIIPFGQYGDCYVFALDRSLKYYTDKTFGDTVFRGYTPGYIFVYRGGEIMTLDAAFDKGYLGENDISTVMFYNADWLYIHKIFKNPNF